MTSELASVHARLVAATGRESLVRAAGPGDAVGGLLPRWVVAPASTDAIGALLVECGAQDLAVVVRGEGTKLDWGGTPEAIDVVLDVGRLAGVDHDAEHRTVTVGAGTPLRAVQAVLSASGQRLPMDPPSRGATIGGMLATGEAGPLRYGHGRPADQLLTVEFVRADGSTASSGGRGARLADGYDLGRMLCGSYGTLGVITSATFRTQIAPGSRRWVTRPVSTPMEMRDIADAVMSSPVDPAAIEVDLPAVPAAPLIPHQRDAAEPATRGEIAVLLEGAEAGVHARAEHLIRRLGPETVARTRPPMWWGRYPFANDQIALKITAPAGDLHTAVYALRDAVGATIGVRGSAGTGVCFASLPAEAGQAAVIDALRHALKARDGSCVVLHAPARVRASLDLWGPVDGLHVMRALKQRFDPARRLAPGRFVGGI